MISARNLSFKRGHRFIFDEVSFDVVPGELVAIFGPNGAGKSSLLQVMAGALKPASGEIIFAGRPLQCSTALDVPGCRQLPRICWRRLGFQVLARAFCRNFPVANSSACIWPVF
jgi:ABC-type cobalamin/Fe3+-siderophores transport system ATPase subunit